jgi:hypothetical protein
MARIRNQSVTELFPCSQGIKIGIPKVFRGIPKNSSTNTLAIRGCFGHRFGTQIPTNQQFKVITEKFKFLFTNDGIEFFLLTTHLTANFLCYLTMKI